MGSINLVVAPAETAPISEVALRAHGLNFGPGSARAQEPALVSAAPHDGLSREVYCVLGMPVDAVSMPTTIQVIKTAASRRLAPFLISTPNLNFLVASRSDLAFRESLLLSDLCTADGMPVVWIARLLGLPIRQRIAGSDIFQALKQGVPDARPLTVFFFGGAEGVAAAAAAALNAEAGGLICVGHLNPGFGSVDELSRDDIIDTINASKADILAVALGASNGQAWLAKNHHRLRVPVRAHLGATINFQAGTVRRAPPTLRKMGLEWLWRIKEEPHLWRRYWRDGREFLRLVTTRVLPLVGARILRRTRKPIDLKIRVVNGAENPGVVALHLSGTATAREADTVITHFRAAVRAQRSGVVLDISALDFVDARFLGILLVLRQELKGLGAPLELIGVSPKIRRLFRLHGVAFLSDGERSERCRH
jgi:N-acetylglucosaminyldiphosphoundecaprenol N-acetyl-beta-D-mannosaminyltransferase